jgi:hypothetical protein
MRPINDPALIVINDKAAEACVEKCGKRQDQGRSTPLKQRHLPGQTTQSPLESGLQVPLDVELLPGLSEDHDVAVPPPKPGPPAPVLLVIDQLQKNSAHSVFVITCTGNAGFHRL